MKTVSYVHPDLATSGGILETKRIGDHSSGVWLPMVLHKAGSPIVAMANVTVPQRPKTLSPWKCTPSICPGGKTGDF